MNKSSESKVKFRQTSNRCKRVLEVAKLAYANKTKESIASQKLGSRGLWQIANSVLNKGKSAIPPLFNGTEVLSSASDKARFAKNFSKNSNLDDSGISLPIFPSRTNLKLYHISITPNIVKKVITNPDSSKASGPECIPVVFLKYCKPELSYILADLFNMCLNYCPDYWWSLYLRMLRKGLLLKTTPLLVFFLRSFKVFKKLVNNRIINHLEKCGLFLIFGMVLGLLDQLQILTVVSDRIARNTIH